MGTHLTVLSESFPKNTNMTGFNGFVYDFCIFVLWMKIASALERLMVGGEVLRVLERAVLFVEEEGEEIAGQPAGH